MTLPTYGQLPPSDLRATVLTGFPPRTSAHGIIRGEFDFVAASLQKSHANTHPQHHPPAGAYRSSHADFPFTPSHHAPDTPHLPSPHPGLHTHPCSLLSVPDRPHHSVLLPCTHTSPPCNHQVHATVGQRWCWTAVMVGGGMSARSYTVWLWETHGLLSRSPCVFSSYAMHTVLHVILSTGVRHGSRDGTRVATARISYFAHSAMSPCPCV